MHSSTWLKAGSALALSLALTGAAAAQQHGELHSLTGHTFRPEQRPATDELIRTLKVPDGFQVDVVARDLGNVRMLAVTDDGTILATRFDQDDVIALKDENGDGKADGEPRTVASNLAGVHGIALRDGQIWLATIYTIYRGDWQNGEIRNLQPIVQDLPDGGQHPRRTIEFGPDGKLYLQVGSSCNSCVEDTPVRAALSVLEPDGAGRRVYAEGLRNPLGFDWHPETGQMWAADHGSDWRGDDLPPDEIDRIEDGKHYGWPYCYGDREPDWHGPGVPEDAGSKEQFCREQTEGMALGFAAHSAPIDFLFYDGEQFPQEYQGDAFVAQRGSWNRETPVGYAVARVHFEDGEPSHVQDFLFRFLTEDRTGHFGRVAGLALDNDGSLLVAEDTNGVIYRVSHEEGRRQARTAQ